MVYIVEGPKFSHKRHLNQLRKRLSGDVNSGPTEQEEAMDVIYDTFSLPTPQAVPQQRRSSRKGRATDVIDINHKRKKY